MITPVDSTPLMALDAAVLDTETTGLDVRVARLVQVGVIRLRMGAIEEPECFESFVNPGLPIPPESTAVHHISDAHVANAPAFQAVARSLSTFLRDDLIIGHTIAFDLEVLRRGHVDAGLPWNAPRALDVRLLARLAAPGLARDDLDGLCAWLGIPVTGRHSAVGDALMTARVFVALVPLLRERGIRTLAEAHAGVRRLAERDSRGNGGLMLPALPEPPAALLRIDSFPYRHRVADVMQKPALFGAHSMDLTAAIALLTKQGTSSLFVRLPDGRNGIVTERDILRAIAKQGGAALKQSIRDIASTPLQAVSAEDYVYRAIGRMHRLSLRHLAVHDAQGEIAGVLTPRNLLRQRAGAALVLGDAIDNAPDVAELARAWGHLVPMARALLAENVDARDIAGVISEEIRALTRRAAQLAEARMAASGHGAPPVPYCVLVLGSAGRGESLIAADQDNAIVFASGAQDGTEDRWFAAMAAHMNMMLDEVGIKLCQGGVMARNAAWRHSQEGWFALVERWVRRQTPEDLLNVDIFFDMSPVHGDVSLGEAVRAHALAVAHHARDFQIQLAAQATNVGPALNLFRRFRTDEQGRTDLKRYGLMPIVASARVLAIRHDVRFSATPARWEGLVGLGVGSATDIAAIVSAHRVILAALLEQQLDDAEAGIPPSTRVATSRLARSELARLKSALGQVKIAIDLMNEGQI